MGAKYTKNQEDKPKENSKIDKIATDSLDQSESYKPKGRQSRGRHLVLDNTETEESLRSSCIRFNQKKKECGKKIKEIEKLDLKVGLSLKRLLRHNHLIILIKM